MEIDQIAPGPRTGASEERALEADIREELLAHLDIATAAGIERGLSPEQARAEALERFGDIEQTVRNCKRAKRGTWIMAKQLNWILTTVLLIGGGLMTNYVFAQKSRLLEREAALQQLQAQMALRDREQASKMQGLIPSVIVARIGDRLEIVESFQPTDWNGTYEVEADGTVLLPVLGHVDVLGFPRALIEERLAEAYAPYYSNLDLRVRVHQDRGPTD